MDSAKIHKPLRISEAEAFWTEGISAYSPAPGTSPETSHIQSGASASASDDSLKLECCAGIDTPGVGIVHSADCPHSGLPGGSGQNSAGVTPVGDGDHAGATADSARSLPPSLHRLLDEQCDSILLMAERIPAEIRASIRGMEQRRQRQGELLGQLLYAARTLAESRIGQVLDHDSLGYALVKKCAECSAKAAPGLVIQHERSCRVGRVFGVVLELIAASEFTARELAEAAQQGGAR